MSYPYYEWDLSLRYSTQKSRREDKTRRRYFKRLQKATQAYLRNTKKSLCRVLVCQMKYADEDKIENLEAKLISAESSKLFIGYLD